jgi:predicted RNase H-like nuclease (RuvC/YqgF family)
MSTKRAEMTVADLYAEMNALEEQALEIKAERKRLGDEIRRRSEAQQLEAKLAQFSERERAELAKLAQTVGLAQAEGKR